MKPHERRATGNTRYFKLAHFNELNQCYMDGQKQYETMPDAIAAADTMGPNRYVVSVVDDSGRRDVFQFDVAE